MMLHGAFTDVESLADLFVASATSQMLQNLSLSLREFRNETAIRQVLARSRAEGSSLFERLDVPPPGSVEDVTL